MTNKRNTRAINPALNEHLFHAWVVRASTDVLRAVLDGDIDLVQLVQNEYDFRMALEKAAHNE